MQERERSAGPVEFGAAYHFETFGKVKLKCVAVLFIDIDGKGALQGSGMVQELSAATAAPLLRIDEQGLQGRVTQRQ